MNQEFLTLRLTLEYEKAKVTHPGFRDIRYVRMRAGQSVAEATVSRVLITTALARQLTMSPQALWSHLCPPSSERQPWIARWGPKNHPLKLERSAVCMSENSLARILLDGSLLSQNTSSKEIDRYHVEKTVGNWIHAGLKEKKRVKSILLLKIMNT